MRIKSLVLAVGVFGAIAGHDGSSAANSLDELLEQSRNVRAAELQLAEERRAAFEAAAPAEQQRLTAEALAARAEWQKLADTASEEYSKNELRIGELAAQLRDKANEFGLGEVFGLARQVAGDAASVLHQSLITTQFETPPGEQDRTSFLSEFAADKTLPSVAELERLWLELLHETTESGRVARYTTGVIQPDGRTVRQEVVRIGPFTATSGRDYLTYLTALETFTVLHRQPPEELRDAAERLHGARGGYVSAVVDASRGVLLSLVVERPGFMERIHQGHLVGYVTIAVGLVGAACFIFQFFYLLVTRITVAWQLRNLGRPSRANPLGRVLLAFKGDPKTIEQDADVAELRISEAVLHEVPKLERFQAFLRLAVAAGPLLGLIGTVIGMIITFQSITESGSSDPKLMASGIGQAMIATVLGLGIAIPLLFANAGLATLSRTVVQILEEQSTGLLAESLEKLRRA
jgi:biopolymer transport protein ExbB